MPINHVDNINRIQKPLYTCPSIYPFGLGVASKHVGYVMPINTVKILKRCVNKDYFHTINVSYSFIKLRTVFFVTVELVTVSEFLFTDVTLVRSGLLMDY